VNEPVRVHHTVPSGLSVAFYKGKKPGLRGAIMNIGRYLDKGPYSHTEVILSDKYSASSSYIDGGVRIKHIEYSVVGNWDFLPIPDSDGEIEHKVLIWFAKYLGAKYDLKGNLRFATNFARDDPNKWFCSESTMASLGFPDPFRYGPSGAAAMLGWFYKSNMVVIT